MSLAAIKHSGKILVAAMFLDCPISSKAAPQEITHTIISGYVCNETSRFRYDVEVRLVPISKDLNQRHYMGAAVKGEFLCTKLAIAFDGAQIKIPKRAYADLAEITSVSSPDDADNGTWTLRVAGGSGGETYAIDFFFNQTRLLERRFIDQYPTSQGKKYSRVEKF